MVSSHILLRELSYFAFALVREHGMGPFQRNPHTATNFDPHRLADVANPSPAVPEEVKAHDLEDALTSAPGACVHVLDIQQLPDAIDFEPRLFQNFAFGGLFGLFALVDGALREGEDPGLLPGRRGRGIAVVIDGVWFDDGDVPFPAYFAQHEAAC